MTMTKMPKLGAVRKYANGGFIDPTQHASQDQIRATIGRPMANTLGTNSDADIAAFQSRLNTPAQPSVSYTNVNTPNNSIQKVVSNAPSPLDRPELGQPRQTSFSNVDVQGYQQKPLGAQNAVADDISNNLLNSAIDEAGTLWGFKDGGEIKGPGTGTSDSIPAALPEGAFIIPAAVVRHYGVAKFDKMNGVDTQSPAGQTIPAMVSNGEYQLSPDAVRRIGTDTLNKLIASVPKEQGADTKVVDGVVNAAGGVDLGAKSRIEKLTGVNNSPAWPQVGPLADSPNKMFPPAPESVPGTRLVPSGNSVTPPVREGIAVKDSFFKSPQVTENPNFTLGNNNPESMSSNKVLQTIPGENVKVTPNIGARSFGDTMAGKYAEPKIAPAFDVGKMSRGTIGNAPRTFADEAAGLTVKQFVSGAGKGIGKVLSAASPIADTFMAAQTAAEPSQADEIFRVKAANGDKDAQRILDSGGFNPIANKLKQPINNGLDYLGDQFDKHIGFPAALAADNLMSGSDKPVIGKQPSQQVTQDKVTPKVNDGSTPELDKAALSGFPAGPMTEQQLADVAPKKSTSPLGTTSLSGDGYSISVKPGSGKTRIMEEDQNVSRSGEPIATIGGQEIDGKTVGGQKVYMKTGAPVAENDLPMLRSRRESTPESRAELGRTIARNADKGFQERMAQQAAIVDERRAKSQAWDDREMQANQAAQEQAYIDNLRATIAAPTVEHDLFGAQRQRREKANALALLGQINDSQIAKAKLGMDSSQFAAKLAQDKESTNAAREANALEKQYQRDQKQSELAKDTHKYTLPNGESFDGTESQFEEAKQLLNDDQAVQKWKDANSKNWGEDDSAYEDRARKSALSKQEIRYDKAGNAFVKDKNGKVIPYKVG